MLIIQQGAADHRLSELRFDDLSYNPAACGGELDPKRLKNLLYLVSCLNHQHGSVIIFLSDFLLNIVMLIIE